MIAISAWETEAAARTLAQARAEVALRCVSLGYVEITALHTWLDAVIGSSR